MEKIAVISNGDKQIFLCDYLISKNYPAELVSNFNFNEYKYIVGATPFSKNSEYINCEFYSSFPISTFLSLVKSGQTVFGGNLPSDFIDYCSNHRIKTVDLLKHPGFFWENSYYTAEGLLGYIICNTDFSLKNSNILVLGLGKCGSMICHLLKKLNANVYFYDNNLNTINWGTSLGYNYLDIYENTNIFPTLNIVINCIPEKLLTRLFLELLDKNCILFDISSFPFGFDKETTDSLSLTLHTCSGIPGKYMTRDSGTLLAKNILSFIEGTVENEPQFR